MPIEDAVREMFNDPTERGIHMLNYQETDRKLGINGRYDIDKLEREMNDLLDNPKCNAFVQLQRWRKIGKKMFEIMKFNSECADKQYEQLQRISNDTAANGNKRWTKEDDELLVDMMCDEKQSLIEIAAIFGRTPNAITTRMSYLVGINRVSTEIAGRFIGKIDGEEINGEIKGTLLKK